MCTMLTSAPKTKDDLVKIMATAPGTFAGTIDLWGVNM